MTPQDYVRKNEHWKKINGLHPKMNVYDQTNHGSRIIVDPNYCVGATVANIYQAQTRKVGDYAKRLYEEGKKRQSEHPDPDTAANADKMGIPIHIVADVATERFGGEYHRITTLGQVLAWLDNVGPVAAGFIWSEGMAYPQGRGSWWRRWFGPKWMTPTHKSGPTTAHCVTILGGSYKQGGFVVIENSEGLMWGNKGTARLSWDHLSAMIEGNKVWLYGIDFKAK